MVYLVVCLTCMFTSDVKEDTEAVNAYMLENFEVIRLVCFVAIKKKHLLGVFILGNSNLWKIHAYF